MVTSDDNPAPLDAQTLTWGALLGHWAEFAQSALALPATPEGQRLRSSVPDLIMLQAVWFALQNLDALEHSERALGLDRAEILIEKHAGALSSRWSAETMPEHVRSLIDDARNALNSAVSRHRGESETDTGGPSD
ncbi:MAG: hypothetical protein NTW19_01060 [Planctomycetota bacterium]|nr:hypothetical protein [Planctomycetota bacterium]